MFCIIRPSNPPLATFLKNRKTARRKTLKAAIKKITSFFSWRYYDLLLTSSYQGTTWFFFFKDDTKFLVMLHF